MSVWCRSSGREWVAGVTESLRRAHCTLVYASRLLPVPEGSSVLLRWASRWTMWAGCRDGDGHRRAHSQQRQTGGPQRRTGEELRGSIPAPGVGAKSPTSNTPMRLRATVPQHPPRLPRPAKPARILAHLPSPLAPSASQPLLLLMQPPQARGPPAGPEQPPHAPPEPGPPGALCPVDPCPGVSVPGRALKDTPGGLQSKKDEKSLISERKH